MQNGCHQALSPGSPLGTAWSSCWWQGWQLGDVHGLCTGPRVGPCCTATPECGLVQTPSSGAVSLSQGAGDTAWISAAGGPSTGNVTESPPGLTGTCDSRSPGHATGRGGLWTERGWDVVFTAALEPRALKIAGALPPVPPPPGHPAGGGTGIGSQTPACRHGEPRPRWGMSQAVGPWILGLSCRGMRTGRI